MEAIDLDDGRRIACDNVVVGIGTVPATAWLAGSGLDPDGVAVDAAGRTAIPGVYAAGDASKRFDPRRLAYARTEHWEAAARQGASAARAMLALAVPPPALPSFWSDQHGIRIQYLGDAHGADQTCASTATSMVMTSPPRSPGSAGRSPPSSSGAHTPCRRSAASSSTPTPQPQKGPQHDP